MAERIWNKILYLTLVMTSLVAGGVTLRFPDAPIVQRVNLGVVMTRVTDDLDLWARTWTHMVRLPLLRERGKPPPMTPCPEDVEAVVCFMDTWLGIQSRLLAAEVDRDIRAAAEFTKEVLPRLPPQAHAHSSSRLGVMGDAFHETLASVRVYPESNVTQLSVRAIQGRVLSVPTEATVAVLAKMAVRRYRDVVSALSQGRLENELLGAETLDKVLQDARDEIRDQGLELTLEAPSLRDVYTSLEVRACVDDDFLYVFLPLTVRTKPPRSLDLYKVRVFPVAAGPGSVHATEIVGLPEYFAVDRAGSKYMTLTSADLDECLDKDPARCYHPSVMLPVEEPSCALGVFLDLAEMIRERCEFDLVHNGAETSMREVMPGLLLLNNVPEHILDCPKFYKQEDTQPLPPCTQCLRHVPCECAVEARDIRFPPYPCMKNSRNLCRLEFHYAGDPHFNASTSDWSSHPDCQPAPGKTSWVTHTVNMALWMALGEDGKQQLRGGDLFQEERDLALPGVERVFQGWDGSLKSRIRGERARILQQRRHASPPPAGVPGANVWAVVLVLVVLFFVVVVVLWAMMLRRWYRLNMDLERQLRESTPTGQVDL